MRHATVEGSVPDDSPDGTDTHRQDVNCNYGHQACEQHVRVDARRGRGGGRRWGSAEVLRKRQEPERLSRSTPQKSTSTGVTVIELSPQISPTAKPCLLELHPSPPPPPTTHCAFGSMETPGWSVVWRRAPKYVMLRAELLRRASRNLGALRKWSVG
mmetsp:Transcript_30460/g.81534  ORF Transcript_30460/g.81534 Transcript_30460/m.81534 type:complete len:157 (-) Transcript_30460:1930-2400(-)